MNRSFSPQHNFQRSPLSFQNRFRMPSNELQYTHNAHQGMQFRSPQHSSPNNFRQRNSHQSPDTRRRMSFGSPTGFPSPQFQSSPRNMSPHINAFNNSWSSNLSVDSSANSSSYFADISGSSPHTREQNFKKQKYSKSDSNPGGSDNIEDYLHPSMLEDPWANDMVEYEKKRKLSKPQHRSDTS